MSIAVAQVLEGMPDPEHLHKIDFGNQVVIMVGARVLFCFPATDLGMRNLAIVTLTELKFTGVAVAAVLGLSPVYVSRVRGWARDHGSAGLVRDRGRPAKLTASQLRRARAWREEGLSDVQIGHRLDVADTTVARNLGTRRPPVTPTTDTDTLDIDIDPLSGEPAADAPAAPCRSAANPQSEAEAAAGPAGRGSGWIEQGVFFSRYAGAMLFHAFSDRLDAGAVLSDALGTGAVGTDAVGRVQGPRFDDLALLTATSMAFGLGAATIEQVKHLTAAEAGPLCGLDRLPDLRTLRPRLAALAERMDPLALQRAFASAMLTADPCTSGVYFVDDHFVPYTGAKPVPKGWDTKHRVAHRGRADTWVVDAAGRAVVFTTGEPSGLTKTLPPALAELRTVIGPDAKITLGFDRGGAYASVFTACRTAHADWITYRRAPLAPVHGLPITTTIITSTDARGVTRHKTLVYADEPVEIDEYGTARQITLFEHGAVVLQVLTSDTSTCPVALLTTLRARWRIENAFKYASEHHGIDALADYIADIETNTRPIDNPARKSANATVKARRNDLAGAERVLAQLMCDRTGPIAALNKNLTTAHARIENAKKALTAAQTTRDAVPAKLPANQIDPDAQRALLHTTRRALQMVLRLLAYNGEHWLAGHLNAYLRDNDEYRAITRQTILRGLTGTITYTPQTIKTQLQPPDDRRITRALTLLLEEINAAPPHLPGDHRPITYTLTPRST
jgi:hypothetical protein